MHDPWHRMIPPAAGFFGAVLMMSYLGEMPTRLWAVALGAGAVTPYFGVPVIVSYLTHTFDWLPRDGGLEGLIGFGLGLLAIHIVGAFATFGRRFSNDPTGSLK